MMFILQIITTEGEVMTFRSFWPLYLPIPVCQRGQATLLGPPRSWTGEAVYPPMAYFVGMN